MEQAISDSDSILTADQSDVARTPYRQGSGKGTSLSLTREPVYVWERSPSTSGK